MSWFEKTADAPARVPTEAIWAVCPSCKAYIEKEAWRAADKVCPRCNYHERLNCRERVALLTDADSFKELNAEVSFNDPLSFSDSSGAYADKAKATVAKTGVGESILTGTATIEQIAVVLGVMDFKFLGGSLGSGTGERIRLAAEKAIADMREEKKAIVEYVAKAQANEKALKELLQKLQKLEEDRAKAAAAARG